MPSLQDRLFQLFQLTIWSIFMMLIVACGGGDSVSVVQSGTGAALTTTAGAAIILTPAQVVRYTISGGNASKIGYTASSSNSAVVTVSVSGSTLSIDAVAAGASTIVVNDNAGDAVSIAVTVSGVSSPSALTLFAPGGLAIEEFTTSQGYQISGGTPPYIVASSAPGVAGVSVVNNQLIVTGLSAGSASIAIFDSTKSPLVSASLSVTVTAISTANLVYVAAPQTIDLAVNGQAAYSVSGGNRNYTATSANATVSTAAINGNNQLVITGISSGTTQIVVSDSSETSQQTINVNVSGTALPLSTTASSPLTLPALSMQTFSVEGGTGPYTTNSSNTAIATSSVSGNTLTINGLATGSANIYVWDSTGQSPQIIEVNVP